ncbi:MAG: PAS domain-containing protein [Idiomarina sp.]|nr:PAS domain-containing protein [Idiomarina sp.]
MIRLFIDHNIETLFAASEQVSLFVWENSPGWPVVYCTENALKLLGYSKSDLESRKVTFSDKVHPDDLERVSNEVKSAIANLEQTSFTHQDYRMVRADQDVIWVSDTTIIQRNAAGETEYLMGYLLDITARKRLELSLASERNYLQQVIEGARLGSWDWDWQTSIVRVNKHWLSMFGLHEYPAQFDFPFWQEHVHEHDQLEWKRALQRHVEGNTPFYEHIYRMQHADGRWLYVLDRGQIIRRDDYGNPIRFSGILTDITSQKEAEIAAQRSAEAKNTMLASVSHEIRTPLHGILGIASLLERQVSDEKQRQMIRTILESGDYLLNSLNDVLDVTRAEQGDFSIVHGAHAIQDILAHIAMLFTERAEQKGIELLVERTLAVPDYLMVDRSRLMQVLINLLDNALKYTNVGSIYVQFDWRAEPSQREVLMIEVRDTGIGIQDTQRIWSLFEQEARYGAKTGSGVGLNVVQNLVRLMGGTIDVESIPNSGSTFLLRLPSQTTLAPQAHAQAKAKAHQVTLPKLRVLVVDDSDVNQLILGEMLQELEQEYVCVSSGEDAIAALTQLEVDIIFMDIHMQGMSGIETTKAIREQLGDRLCIVALTANAIPMTESDGLAAGMNGYLPKPFTLRDIEEILHNCVKHIANPTS